MSADKTERQAESANPRAQRSKSALIEAMTYALDTYEFKKPLSIAEISRAAGVSRPTIYQHFGDLANLIHAAAMTRLAALFENLPQTATDTAMSRQEVSTSNALWALLTELEQRRGFYVTVLDSMAGGAVREEVIKLLATRIIDATAPESATQDADPSEEEVHEQAMFLAAGAVWRTEHWLRRDPTELAERLAHRLSRILASAAGLHNEYSKHQVPTALDK